MDFGEITLGQVLREQAAAFKDKDFIIYSDRDLRYTYGEFDRRVDDLAKGFLTIGLKKGDHVGIWAANVPDWSTVFFAAARAGMVLVTINPNYKRHELEYQVRHADLNALCIIDRYRDSDYVDMINQLVPELKTDPLGQLHSEKFPCLKTVINIGEMKHRGMYNLSELILIGSNRDDTGLKDIEAQADFNDVLCIMYTSGTTGFPKGVMLTHRNILNNAFFQGQRMGAREDSILCNPLPLFHIFGLTCGLVTMLVFGARIAILEAFDPLMVLAVIQKEKCTIMFGVNTMYIALLNHPMLNMFNLQTLRTGAMGGAACPPEVMKQVMERMHIPGLYSGYGLTESSPVVTNSAALDDPIEMRINSIGRALPGIEVTIRNPETNEELPVNTEGEICSRGYATMKGYYKMEEETKKVIDEDGWLHTGDLGHLLPNGFVQITGRIKDMIIRGGENIYPKEVEDFLYSMPGIKDAQVVGIPSKKYGEEVAAFVILKENVTLTEEDVIDYCRGKISNFKIPRYVFFVDAYPLTASGKIQKFKLRETGEQKLQKTGSVI